MRYLAIDTSGKNYCAAVYDGKKYFSESFDRSLNNNSEEFFLLELLNKILFLSGLKIDQIDKLILGTGPGSFTGLRIGCAFLKGIAVALGKGIIEIPTFPAIANALANVKVKRLILEYAGRNEFFAMVALAGSATGKESVDIWNKVQICEYIKSQQNIPFNVLVRHDLPELEETKTLIVNNWSEQLIEISRDQNILESKLAEVKLEYKRAVNAKTIAERLLTI